MIVFYHSADLDGHCCGAIAWRTDRFKKDLELIGIDYGHPFPWDKIQGQDVLMADFSIQPIEGMVRLEKEAKSLIWIDHHKSAIEEAVRINFNPPGVRDSSKAACELLWKFVDETEPVRAVYLLGRYDVWDHTDPEVLPFQFGMRLYDTNPKSKFWDDVILNPKIREQVIEEGKTVIRFKKTEAEKYQKAASFETTFEGCRVRACNVGLVNSQAFDVWSDEGYEIFMPFYWKKGSWTVSLYSTSIDVSGFAKARGGGGHKNAAGFQCKELPEGFLK